VRDLQCGPSIGLCRGFAGGYRANAVPLHILTKCAVNSGAHIKIEQSPALKKQAGGKAGLENMDENIVLSLLQRE
jgi:hypothetical protein